MTQTTDKTKQEIVVRHKTTGCIAHTFANFDECANWYATKDAAGVFDRPLAFDERDLIIEADLEELAIRAGEIRCAVCQ